MNAPHVIEVALLLLVTFLIGCVIGFLLRRTFGSAQTAQPAPSPEPVPRASPIPALSQTEIAPRPRGSGASIAGAMSGAAAAAGASDIAAQASDPGGSDSDRPVEEEEGQADMAALAEMNGATPDSSETVGTSLDSVAAADAAAGASNRPARLAAPRPPGPDNLKRIKGIGPKLESTLHGLGVYHFDQIATWTRGNIDWVDSYLSFKGRIDRDEWVAQARIFAGDADD